MPWCKITITYGPTGYNQNYKRQLGVHSHPLSQQFTQDALADSLQRINAHLPPGSAPATQNQLGTHSQGDQIQNDPGPNWRLI